MIDPAKCCLFIPGELKKFKLNLFNRIGQRIKQAGGRTIRSDHMALAALPRDLIPIVGAAPYLLPLVMDWRASGRTWIGWDRGYVRRVFATWLPRGDNGGMYRWTVNAYQMRRIRDVPDDRWKALIPGQQTDPRPVKVLPWQKDGRHIVVAEPSPTYARSHENCETWTKETLARLAVITKRPIVVRGKESSRPLQDDLRGAHCLVAHGSMAAVEAVICGCPVFVHSDSAASLVGQTDLTEIESPVYPERQPWLNSLAYGQYSESELVDGTLWRLIE
jgi:hypothetical protein